VGEINLLETILESESPYILIIVKRPKDEKYRLSI
jgi:hypothetical protein